MDERVKKGGGAGASRPRSPKAETGFTSSNAPTSYEHPDGHLMKQITAIIAALGFLGSTMLTPALAATSNGITKSDDFSAKKKKKKKRPRSPKRRWKRRSPAS